MNKWGRDLEVPNSRKHLHLNIKTGTWNLIKTASNIIIDTYNEKLKKLLIKVKALEQYYLERQQKLGLGVTDCHIRPWG